MSKRLNNVIESKNSNFGIVCILDHNRSTLRKRSEIFSSAGWEVKPFTHRDTFIEYARIHSPQAAVVDFGGSSADGVEVAARVKEASPNTSIVICLRTHRGAARQMLPDRELMNLIARQHATNSRQLTPQPAVKRRFGGSEFDFVN